MLERFVLTPSKRFGSNAAFGLLLLGVTVGCNRGPTMYDVKGHVFYKDGSVPKGSVCVVFFQPKKDTTAEIKKGASGNINPDGSFELWTRKAGDGVYKGEYDVGFTVLASPMNPKPLIVEKYASPATSGYSVVVDGNKSDLKFEIEPAPGTVGGSKGG